MKSIWRCSLLVAVVVGLAGTSSMALSPSDYGKTFHGDGTYYGETKAGNCAMRDPLPSFYSGMIPVAVGNGRYGDSDICGACLLVTGSGKGAGSNPIKGTFKAYVNDRCPECAPNDIDLSKSGDGRWAVKWKVVPCPPGSNISFQFEGSNRWYFKLQPRGMQSPASSVLVDGVKALRTQDNHFVVQSGNGFGRRTTVVVNTVLGQSVTTKITGHNGVVTGSVTTTNGGKTTTTSFGNGSGKQKCAGAWQRCGPIPGETWSGSTCCSDQGYICRQATNSNVFEGARCEKD